MGPALKEAKLEVGEHEYMPASYHFDAKEIGLARQAAEEEHKLGLVDAIRRYPKAALWSILVSTSIIMEGYDIVLIQSFFAQPSFRQKYGQYIESTGSFQITASWQNGLTNAVSVGTIIGAFANGYFTHHFGYRKVLLASLIAICAFIFISFFSPSLPVLLVGQFLCGIPWGVFATMAPAYASEVCPMALRGYLAIYVNLCWALGQLVSAGVQSGFSGIDGQWSYRIPFAIQWAWPLPLFIVLWFAPESPWHYVRAGDYEQAEEAAGLPSSISFRMSVGGLGIASVGTVASWFLLHRLGRRTIYLWGLGLLTMILLTVGFISIGAPNSESGNYAQAGMMLVWLGIYYLTVGPICYAIISEVSSTRLRSKSVCLSRITYYIAQIICNIINPYMLNPTAGDWKGKTDLLFLRRVKAKDFKSADMDVFVSSENQLGKL
ncbi:unnamed protein product [Parascedosporium putredinis]|uniref:Major facilitator superfamily (MFS) profile domain-containing protein n=1 Tax=Parascedosporium putredinis TaxID=1442378 RepID=A0A9P1GZ98_9PEZI|nr:unnamed protein product [Parascedosporium putredinis]CAI7992618.1 unnamed protein product [Parascedosporium putredinis]